MGFLAFPLATTPLADADLMVIEQGGNTRRIEYAELVGDVDTSIGALTSEDIDTLAELNAIITDATLVDEAHTHTESDITDLQAYLLDITNEPIGDLSDVSAASPGTGDQLTYDGASWSKVSPVYGRWTFTSGPSILSSSVDTLVFDNAIDEVGVSIDAFGYVSLPANGVYLITASARWSVQNAESRRFIWIKDVGNATRLAVGGFIANNSESDVGHSCSVVVAVTTSISIAVDVYQDSGVSLSIDPDEEATHLSVARIATI